MSGEVAEGGATRHGGGLPPPHTPAFPRSLSPVTPAVVPVAMTRRRSACPRAAWSSSPNTSPSSGGPRTATTRSTRGWWRSSSPMSSGPSPVSPPHPSASPLQTLTLHPPHPPPPFFPPPGALTQAIRNFAKSLESWLTNAMMNIPEEMVRVKVRRRGEQRGRGGPRGAPPSPALTPTSRPPPAPQLPTGGGSKCLCPDAAALHVPQPPGAGGTRRPAEHGPDQPDAQRPQPGRLRQRPGAVTGGPPQK